MYDLTHHIEQFALTIHNKHFVLPLAHREVLSILSEHQVANLTQIANLRGVRKSSMSVMMNQLLDQNLVVCGASKSDRRQRLYLISRQGKELLQQEREAYQSWLTSLLNGFTEAERSLLSQLLEKVNHLNA